ncbi:hypothetical protein Tco_1173914 [Tanacetum coccineum]
MSYLSASITVRITEQVKNQLPQILPKEVSNFAPPVIQSMVTKSLEHAVLAKESLQPKSTYEVASSLIEFEECYNGLIKSYDLDKSLFSTYDKVYSLKRSQKDKDKDEDPSIESDRGLKKRKTSKDAKPTKGPKAKESQSGSSKGAKSQSKSSGKLLCIHHDRPKDHQSESRNHVRASIQTSQRHVTKLYYVELEYDFEECYKALLEKLDWNNPEGGDYLFDLTKPLPLVMNGNCQIVQSPIKVTYDKHALWGISHWRDQLTRVEVMRKHRHGYLREIEVRRVDNDLYTFKECDFPRLRINDIKDMLLLIVQNRLTNLLGNDVSDFAIALQMFTRSIVIQKRVEDLQLGVESYQKKINVTKPETSTRHQEKDPTLHYQRPCQGFIKMLTP